LGKLSKSQSEDLACWEEKSLETLSKLFQGLKTGEDLETEMKSIVNNGGLTESQVEHMSLVDVSELVDEITRRFLGIPLAQMRPYERREVEEVLSEFKEKIVEHR